MSVIALISFPIMTGLMVTAEPFVLTFFGPKWDGVIPLLQILALVGAMQALTNPVGWIYLSQGRTDWMFRFGLVSSSVVILAILVGVMLGSVEAVAACYAVANVVLFYPTLAIPGKLIQMAPREVLWAVSGPLAASVAMGALVILLNSALPAGWAPWLQLGVLALLGAGCYGAWVIGFRLKAWNEILTFGKEIRPRTSSVTANVGATL
jgi:PST family polysaccharide transporter